MNIYYLSESHWASTLELTTNSNEREFLMLQINLFKRGTNVHKIRGRPKE
jgi:hypothetical protein